MGWFTKGLEAFLGADIDIDTHKVTAILIDCNNAGPSAGAYKITGVTNADPSTITTQAAHGLAVGDEVEIFSVGGAVGVNGVQIVNTVPTSTTFTVDLASAPGAYTSGGFILDLSITFESELAVASNSVISTVEIPTSGRSKTNGVLDLPDATFSAVSHPTGGSVQAWAIVKAGPTPGGASDAASARRLIIAQTPATAGLTGLPATPNSTNLNLTFSAQGVGSI